VFHRCQLRLLRPEQRRFLQSSSGSLAYNRNINFSLCVPPLNAHQFIFTVNFFEPFRFFFNSIFILQSSFLTYSDVKNVVCGLLRRGSLFGSDQRPNASPQSHDTDFRKRNPRVSYSPRQESVALLLEKEFSSSIPDTARTALKGALLRTAKDRG
jgi:hypothetical protein